MGIGFAPTVEKILSQMPERHRGEPLSKFIGRFVGSKREQKYPIKQRLAIGYSEARQQAKKERRA
jgi:hypothetical protein